MKKIEDAIVKLVKERQHVTFIEIRKLLDDSGVSTKGGYAFFSDQNSVRSGPRSWLEFRWE